MQNASNRWSKAQIWKLIVAVSVILGIIASLITIYLFVLPNLNPSPTGTRNTPVQRNTTSTVITSSPTSPPPPEVILVNLSIPCISADCSYHPLQLTLTTITIDSTNNQTDLTFNVRKGCTFVGTSFQTVELQDPAGNTYKGIVSDNSWSAETIIKVAVFDNLIMKKNVEYLLNVGMGCSIYNDVFKAEYIKV